jgi:microcystin degradation protein MlrC/acyl-CoA synthetase (AMP-forming)/AMP-acid ligase II
MANTDASDRPLRVFTAGIGTESNTFLGKPITEEDFASCLLYRPGEHPEVLTEVSAPLHVLRQAQAERGWDLHEGTYAFSLPGGRVLREVYERLRDEILVQIARSGPLDFIALSLHGAMCAEGYDDCEGDLLKRIRALVGPRVPIGAEIDLHAHLTDEMVRASDIIVAFKEYPHTDFLDRARELITMLERSARSGWRPEKAVFDCRTIGRFHTTVEPVQTLVNEIKACEEVPGISSVSFIHGFPGGDVRDAGSKVLVYADSYDQAVRCATRLGQEVIKLRAISTRPLVPIEEALTVALGLPDGPVVIADVDDNPGSGSSGRDTTLIARLLERANVKACVGPLWDPGIVQAAITAGVGGVCQLPQLRWNAGEGDLDSPLTAQIVCVKQSVFQSWSGTQMPLGPCCALRIGELTIVVSSIRDQAYAPDFFTALDVDPEVHRIVVVKSAQHFIAGFASMAAHVILATGGGPLKSDVRSLPYRKVARPIWPLDPVGRPNCLHHWLEHWAQVRPNAEAAIDARLRLTYAELANHVQDFAAALVEAGVEPGDRVVMLSAPSVQFLICFLATASIGAIWVGLNPRYSVPELDGVVAKVEPSVVFCQASIDGRNFEDWALATSQLAKVVLVDVQDRRHLELQVLSDFLQTGKDLSQECLVQRWRATRPVDPCLIVFTSGSSGPPKGALISHGALSGVSEVQVTQWNVYPLRVLNNLPINHIGCVGDLACYALIGGGTTVFAERFSASSVPGLIKKERISVYAQVPSMFQLALDAPGFDPAALEDVKLIFWGGAQAPKGLLERLRTLCPWLATSYGQTETVGSVTFTSTDASLELLAATVGRVVAPYQVRIAASPEGPDGQEITGEVEVRTPFGFAGYWRNVEATKRAWTEDGWLRTGDVGELMEDGSLRLIGRVHNVFKAGGYNVNPEEIEEVLMSIPGVVQAAVVATADSVWGNVPVAFIVTEDGVNDSKNLDSFLRERLANYKIPKKYHFQKALPLLPIGKVDKRALAELAASNAS